MVTYEELVEKVARVLNPQVFEWYDRVFQYTFDSGQSEAEAIACAKAACGSQRIKALSDAATAIATIREALKEPSEAMVTAGMNELDSPFYADIERVYRAMLAASPLVEEERP